MVSVQAMPAGPAPMTSTSTGLFSVVNWEDIFVLEIVSEYLSFLQCLCLRLFFGCVFD